MALLPFFLRIELLWLPKDLISFSGRESLKAVENVLDVGGNVAEDRETVDGPVAIVVTNVPDVAMVLQI